MSLRRHRPDARSATAVRDAEGLVQVEVRDVAAHVAESAEADQRIEVGAVDVDLAAGVVHGIGDGPDLVLIHPVCGGVGDHERGQRGGVQLDLGAQIRQIHVPRFVTRHHDHAHSG